MKAVPRPSLCGAATPGAHPVDLIPSQAVQMANARAASRQEELASLQLLQPIGKGGYGVVYRCAAGASWHFGTATAVCVPWGGDARCRIVGCAGGDVLTWWKVASGCLPRDSYYGTCSLATLKDRSTLLQLAKL